MTAECFLSGYVWSKQTKIASVLTPCLHNTTPLTKNTCRYRILFTVQIDRITWRKTKPVTTTIILIRPLYWAGMSHMQLRPRCQGLEWLIILPSSLTAPPCSPPTQYWSTIPEITVSAVFSAKLLKLQKGSQADSSCVWVLMKRLLILLFSYDANVVFTNVQSGEPTSSLMYFHALVLCLCIVIWSYFVFLCDLTVFTV